MSGPKFNGQISLGNILSMVVIVLAGFGAWMGVKSSIQANAAMISQQAMQIEGVQKLVNADRAKVVQLEIANARTDERINIIVQGIAEIKASLNKGGFAP